MTMDNDEGADMGRKRSAAQNVVRDHSEEYETLKQRSPARCPAEEVIDAAGDLEDDDGGGGDFKERYECK